LGDDSRALFVSGGLSLLDVPSAAFALFERSASAGNAKAMNRLGLCYNFGQVRAFYCCENHENKTNKRVFEIRGATLM
jgi:TPR repeat protein